MRRFILGVIVLLAFSQAAMGACEGYNTPNLFIPTNFELNEGEYLEHDAYSTVIDERTKFTFAEVNSSLESFRISEDGYFEANPGQEEVGVHKILIIGVADNDCYDSELITVKVNDRPEVSTNPEAGEVKLKEGKGIHFKSFVEDTDDDTHEYIWSFNGEEYSNSSSFQYLAGYNDSGIHEVKLEVKDSLNLTDEVSWKLVIQNVNRPPVFMEIIPSVYLLVNQTSNIFDLSDYFADPDGDDITFSFVEVAPTTDASYRLADVSLGIDGNIVEARAGYKDGYRYYKFIATDERGATTESNSVQFSVHRSIAYTRLNYCGDDYCSNAETCSNCPSDCGGCQISCTPAWQCGEWGACLPSNIQVRECQDLNGCGVNKDKPAEARECVYEPSCDDGIKNQDETGVDCGGSCGPCGTCFDNIKNQGEEGVDCGGPCDKQCPTCFDNLKNGNETDVDCGGPCRECGAGRSCKTNFDCASFKCVDAVCQPGTCSDNIQNQGEGDVDCGGPCEPCPTCNDGIRNQGEVDVDCGGENCEVCPTCSDGVKNQEEFITDCGGPNCGSCGLKDYLDYFQFKKYFFGLLVFVVLLIFGTHYFINSRLYYSVSKGGLFTFLESDSYLPRVIMWNRFFRKLRIGKAGLDTNQYASKALNRLEHADHDREDMAEVLEEYFDKLFMLRGSSTYRDIYMKIKTRSVIPFFDKILLVMLLKKYWFLKNQTGVYSEETTRIKRQVLIILDELDKDL